MTLLDPGMGRGRSLRGRLSVGALAFAGSMVATRVLGLVSIAVLGRLLTPEDFGIMALATLVTGTISALLGRHFEIALIRTPNPERAHFGSAFALSIAWGSLMAALVLLLSDPAAALLRAPEVAPALRWLALIPLLDGLRNPGFSVHERALRFFLPAISAVTARFAVVVVSISLALVLQDYWAMVAGLIAYSATRTLFSHLAAPTVAPTLARWRDFLSFSGWMTGLSLVGHLNHKIDRAFVGAELGVAEAGRYRIGHELATMATSEIAVPLLRVIYPGLVERSDDPQALRRAYNKAQGLMLALLMPAGVGLALVAEDALRVAVGAQWTGAAPVIQVFAPLHALIGLTSGVHALIFIRGEPRTLFFRNVAILLCLVPALWLGIELAGFTGLLAARGAVLAAGTVMTLHIAARAVGTHWWTPILAGWRTFGACAAMVLAVIALQPLLPEGMELAAAAKRLVTAALVGALAYVGVHLALWRLVGAPDGPERESLAIVQTALRGRLPRWRARLRL